MSALRLLIGRMRTDRLPALLIVVLVLVTACVAAAAPRLLNRVTDAGLRYEIRHASVIERNLQLGRITRIEAAANDGMNAVASVERQVHGGLPDSVQRIISGSTFYSASVTWRVSDRPPTRPGFMTLHLQGDLGDEISLVDGRMPTGAVEQVVTEPPPGVIVDEGEFEAPVFEVALSTATADALDVGIGDRMELTPDPDDPLVGQFGIPEKALIDVVGLFDVTDPNGDFWVGDYTVDHPVQVPVGINVVQIYATALLSPDAYPAVVTMTPPMRYGFRYFIDPDRLDAGMLDELVTDLNQMEASYASFAAAPDPTRTTLQSSLLDLARSYLRERRSTEAVLTTAAIGPGAVALAALGALALLAMRRRRGTLILLRGRGGSVAQIVGSHVIEGLLLAVGPAALGWLAATALVDARPAPMSSLAAGGVALGTILVLAAAVLPTAIAPLRQLGREAPASIGASPRRLAFEGLAVGLAVGGVVLLRQRGLAGGSAAGQLGGVDPFLAAVPALVGIAVGIVTLRLYPYPIRAAGWAAASGRGLVPALGLRRAERQAGTGQLPLVVLLLTVAIGTFSSTMLATIDGGQVSQSWQTVGAAYRVTSDTSLEALDLTGVAGVSAVAGAHEADANVGIAGGGVVRLVAIDALQYDDVTVGTPADADLPPAFTEPLESDPRPGTTENPVPVIVTRALERESTTNLRPGSTFQLSIAARFATFRVVDIRDRIPGQGAGQLVYVPRDALQTALGDRAFPPTTLFVDAPPSAAGAIASAVDETGLSAQISSQSARLEALRERPLVDAVRIGFAGALGIAVGYAALAVIVALVLSGSARARETAHLRTMGIGRRQVTMLAVIEHAPPVLVAVIAGLLLGVAVAWVVLPGLGLGAFTGGGGDPALAIDVGQLAVLTLALLAIVAVGIGLAALAQRSMDPARAIRSAAE